MLQYGFLSCFSFPHNNPESSCLSSQESLFNINGESFFTFFWSTSKKIEALETPRHNLFDRWWISKVISLRSSVLGSYFRNDDLHVNPHERIHCLIFVYAWESYQIGSNLIFVSQSSTKMVSVVNYGRLLF